jgi:hypothetical protein
MIPPITTGGQDEWSIVLKEEKHAHNGYGFLTKSSDSYQSIDVIASSSDEQAVPVYNPHVQSYTDSYQSIQSIDSSVNSLLTVLFLLFCLTVILQVC